MQQVAQIEPGFEVTDDDHYLSNLLYVLHAKHSVANNRETTWQNRYRFGSINGFLMVARTDTFNWHRLPCGHVFNPGDRYKMIRGEDEITGRYITAGLKVGCVLSSFVFHYRGVTRPEGRRGKEAFGLYRRKD